MCVFRSGDEALDQQLDTTPKDLRRRQVAVKAIEREQEDLGQLLVAENP
ncbi:MAG: hypothetical protein H0T79_06055 [Deltaproteobacteria bacterium]|nr:hypothetical protein [Deltaproteobacteria bacterium]